MLNRTIAGYAQERTLGSYYLYGLLYREYRVSLSTYQLQGCHLELPGGNARERNREDVNTLAYALRTVPDPKVNGGQVAIGRPAYAAPR